MTAAAAPAPTAAPRWFFGPLSDLMLGCGLLYFAVFGLQLVAGDAMESVFPRRLLPLFTLALGAPHYGATLLRAYGDAESRRRYAFFCFGVTALLGLVFVYGLRDHVFGSMVLTLYLTWSPWHYSAQNYGVSVAFLRRSGVPLGDGTKRLLYTTFLLSYALAFSSVHRASESADYVPVSYRNTVYELIPLGIPGVVQEPLFALLLLGWAASTAFTLFRLLQDAPVRKLLPTFSLLGLQALWFVVPPLAGQYGWLGGAHPFAPGNAAYTLMWVAGGHFVQYLWITTYFAEGSSGGGARALYLGRCLLLGAALWILPALVFAPGLLGSIPYDFGLAAFTAATVNLHHFVLDGAIWKFRDAPVSRILVLGQRTDVPARAWPGSAWLARGFLLAGAVALGVALHSFYQSERIRGAIDREDWRTMEHSIAQLERIGRLSPRHLSQLGLISARSGDPVKAEAYFERSIALHPTVEAYSGYAAFLEQRGRVEDARRALEAGVALDPRDGGLLYRLGVLLLDAGEAEAARQALARAAELEPDRRLIRLKLAQAEERAGTPAP